MICRTKFRTFVFSHQLDLLERSYISFLETMKPHLNSAKGLLDKRKYIWRKQFLTFLTGTLVDEEEQKIYDDNSKTHEGANTNLRSLMLENEAKKCKNSWGG